MNRTTAALSAAFLATVPVANWMIHNVGTCAPNGPCLVPVWPSVMAPSGVLVIGAALVLRDALRERLGLLVVLTLVLAGAVLSMLLAPQKLVVASFLAFLAAEAIDTAVYEPLRRRGLAVAVLLSGVVGAVVDSVLFLQLAFGSLDFVLGQVIGKLWASAIAAAFIEARRQAA